MKSRQHGVALVIALLVVSLATILAVSLVDHLNYDIRRTENILRLDQAQLYNQTAVDFAKTLISLDRNENNEYDSLSEYSEANEQVFPVSGGQVLARVIDLQGCYNLNQLAAPDGQLPAIRSRYRTLLLSLGIDSSMVETLVDSLIDWLDSDDISEPFGAEFDYYLGLEHPYRSANTLMISPSELRLVKGYTPDIIEQLHGHICVLPTSKSGININTASLEVLESIDGLAGKGEQIIRDRDGDPKTFDDDVPFATLGDFTKYAKDTLQIKNFNSEGLQVYSEYFLLEATTQLGTGNVTLFSMIYRNQNNGTTELIRQSRSTF